MELDPARIEQEIVLLAQKIDVAEELDRLEMHISETIKIMKKGGACGRRLDFMMQEFNRESNTLGSKSINAEVTQSAVELKVLIEQMREQIQNIESIPLADAPALAMRGLFYVISPGRSTAWPRRSIPRNLATTTLSSKSWMPMT